MDKLIEQVDVYDNGVAEVKFSDGTEQVVTNIYYHDAFLILDDEQTD